MKARDLSTVLIGPMTDGHADAVLAIYQTGIDEGPRASVRERIARHHSRWRHVVLIERRSRAI